MELHLFSVSNGAIPKKNVLSYIHTHELKDYYLHTYMLSSTYIHICCEHHLFSVSNGAIQKKNVLFFVCVYVCVCVCACVCVSVCLSPVLCQQWRDSKKECAFLWVLWCCFSSIWKPVYVAVCCSVLQIAGWFSVLQCFAVCCSVLQCVASRRFENLFTFHLTHPYVWDHPFLCVTWLICMCDMTHSYVFHDSFICATWLIPIYDKTHSYMQHGSLIFVIWLIHMCDMTHSYVWHDSFICATKLFHKS